MTTPFSRDILSPSPPPSPQILTSTPKRKRDDFDLTSPTPSPETRLNIDTNISNTAPSSHNNADMESPRTKVASDLYAMHLEDRSRVSQLDFQLSPTSSDEEIEDKIVRKKLKVARGSNLDKTLPRDREIPETPPSRDFKLATRFEKGSRVIITECAEEVLPRNPNGTVIFKGSNGGKAKGGLARAYPSINRLSDSKSRDPKKRMGSPPLLASTDPTLEAEIDEAERRVVDPDRAALTWHDDEITGHDPSDPEDDGEGINGIGFQPTPAMAYALTEKRKQQMAEYRNREAREARAKRSERRRGPETSKGTITGEKAGADAEGKETARRVRFFEGMVDSVIPTI